MNSKKLWILPGILIFTLLISIVPNGGQSDTEPYFTNVELSHDDIWPHHVEPTMAIGPDGTIYVGFKNAQTDVGGGYQVSYTFSEDNGETWSRAVDMPDLWEGARQSDPWMVMYKDTLYYAYLEFDDTGSSQLTMAFTSDKGSTWEIVGATSNNGFADKETFDVDALGNIFMVYDDVANSVVNMRLTRSYDGGYTFFDNVSIQFPFSPDFLAPYIVAGQAQGELFVSWSDIAENELGKIDPELSDIYFAKSSDHGITWTEGVDINPEYNASIYTTGSEGRPSKISLSAMEQDSNGRIYLVWADVSNPDGHFDVWMRYSDTKGETWSDRLLVNELTTKAHQWMPDLEVDAENNVHLAYYEDYDGVLRVKYRKFYADTNVLSEPIVVNDQNTSSSFTRPGDYLSIRVDANNLPHIVWSDARDNSMDIYYGHLIPPIITDTPPQESNEDDKSKASNDRKIVLPVVFVDLIILSMTHRIVLKQFRKKS